MANGGAFHERHLWVYTPPHHALEPHVVEVRIYDPYRDRLVMAQRCLHVGCARVRYHDMSVWRHATLTGRVDGGGVYKTSDHSRYAGECGGLQPRPGDPLRLRGMEET